MAEQLSDDHGDNKINGQELNSFLLEIQREQHRIDEIMQKAREKAAPFRDKISDVKKRCRKELKVSGEVLNVHVRERKLKTKLVTVADKLNDDQRDEYDMQVEALLPFMAEEPQAQAAE